MKKISVIIPVYNGEKYLKEALDSIKNQTMDFDDIEVIIVSDGSTDRTDEIANNYVKENKNCKFFRNEIPSGGAGKPRNIGIELAIAEYLMFLDTDDFFEKDAIEKMYKLIKDTDYNFVNTNYNLVDVNGRFLNKNGFDKNLPTRELTLEDLKSNKMYCNGAVWNKIFKKDFIEKNNIKFLEDGEFAEDLYFTSCSLLESEKVLFVPSVISVNYREVDTSISRDISAKYFGKMNRGYLKIYNKFKEFNKEEYCKNILAEAKVFFIDSLMNSKEISNEQFVEILDEMQWYFSFLNDFKFGNETKEIEEISKNIIDKNYEKLTRMRAFSNTNIKN